MSTAFQPMTPADQTRFRDAYLAHLRDRDGVPDMQTQRFDVREKFFADLDANPNCWVGPPPVDQQVFDRNHLRRRPEPGLDEKTLWAVATAKTNRAERYGVEYSLVYQTHAEDAESKLDEDGMSEIQDLLNNNMWNMKIIKKGTTPPYKATVLRRIEPQIK